MLIDTHAHINFSAYKDDGEEVIKRSLAEGTWLINVGSEKDTSRRAVEYAQKYKEGVFAAVGLHPGHLADVEYEEEIKGERVKFSTAAEVFDAEHYFNLAREDKVVAIGEIGLDYYRTAADKRGTDTRINAEKNLQKEVLLEQLGLAEKLNKPVMLHCREAHEDLIGILKNFNNYSSSPSTSLGVNRVEKSKNEVLDFAPAALRSNNKLTGVVHSFSGRWSQAQQYLAMGFYLGFNGIITFARDYDRVVKEMPLERLVLETDCPYLTPEPFRSKRNEPSYVRYVAQKVAELRGISVEEVAEVTTRNARELFKI